MAVRPPSNPKNNLRSLPRSGTRPRSHSRTQAHAYNSSPAEEDLTPDLPRPIISTKYKTANPLPRTSLTPLRRVHTESAAVLPPRPSNGVNKRKVMRADHAFDAESDSELSIYPGDKISVLEEVDPGWYLGEISDAEGTRQGLFPATYCTVIEEPIGRRASTKPASSPTRENIPEEIPAVRARPSLGTRSVSASPVTNSPAQVKKKPPPPPVPRGSKPSAANQSPAGTTCRECGCDEFRANVFKKGSCNNCFHVHVSQ